MARSYRDLAVTFRRTARLIDERVRKAERESAEQALKIARQLSSGKISSAQLRQRGHPYAARNPRPPQDPAIVNVQSGAFRDGWKITGPRTSSKGLVTRLVNTSKPAKFLGRGTSRMIPRPIADAITQQLRRDRKNRLARALRQALKGR
jgi:hypothetical protein